ncbi:phage protease [Chachezhania antarctica]|uniref:phage protease n=1 Tax=Chachezhania antarctica TaxID=2340860 RepID=UPI000EB15934|nr:phage protease [Chachezhania antarctica]|tara:strand:- start:1697 stop:2752 length:1056 start_codon:yes stop_codon:yes gene_type:complete
MDNALITLSAMELPAPGEGAAVPEWVQLLPKGQVAASDGRGPWHYDDAKQVIEESFSRRRRIHIDENHSTDTAAKLGLAAPARGFITEMEERADGIWGRVDWTDSGRALLSDRAYWGISPVLAYEKQTGKVSAISRAALTNDPALRELLALNSTEKTDMFAAKIAKMLGLGETATEDEIAKALEAKLKTKDESEDALSGALTEIGAAMGLDGDLTTATLVATAKGLKSAGGEQSEAFATLQAEVQEWRKSSKRDKAEAFVDGAIRDLRAGVKASREEYVTLHMENPERAEKLIAGLPKLDRSGTTITPPAATQEGQATLSADQAAAARLIGIDPKAYAETLKAEAAAKETF